MADKIILNPEVWEKIFSSPIFKQINALLRQTFKSGLGFGDMEKMGLTREDLIRINGPASKKEPFPFCALIGSTTIGKQRCIESGANARLSVSTTGQIYLNSCHAGLTKTVVPIMIQGIYHGCIAYTYGILRHPPNEEEWSQIAQRVKDTGVDLDQLKQLYFQITPVSQEVLEVMLKLFNVVIEEIAKVALESAADKKRISELEKDLRQRYQFENIIGKSKPMQEVFALIEKVIESDSTVLIQGESGTGKELVVRAIHYNSLRKNKAFVVQNCAAFSDQILESELFGHIKGSFTGAIKDKSGLFEIADGGTFFLDEVSEMSPTLQVKFLRVIQEGTFIPVGSTTSKKVDVRIITATNQNLKELVGQKKFREDLYYRLDVIRINLPPLRERKEDIPLLVKHFLEKSLPQNRPSSIIISSETLKLLVDYNWPGNIRELENEIERLLVLGKNEKVITEKFLSKEIYQKGLKVSKLPSVLNDMEKETILKTLEKHKGNRTYAAQELGVSRRTLLRKIKCYKISRNQ